MGSLMSGWSSPVLGDKKVHLMRNRSLTKEEVDAFWRQRGRPADDNGQGSPLGSPRVVSDAAVSPLPSPRRSELQQDQSPFEARRLDAVRSLPSPLARGAGSSSSHGGGRHVFARSEPSSPAARTEGFPDSAAADSPSTSCDWWTRSSWAFLNEPHQQQQEEEEVSVSSGSAHKHKGYAWDQFSVTRIVTGNA